MDKLSGAAPPSAFSRLSARLISAAKTWPDARRWLDCAGVGVATLAALGVVGFSTGLYAPHRPNVAGMPLRLITVLIAPAIGEEVVFRGLLVPGRAETSRPAAGLMLATFVFVIWHLVETATFLPSAAPIFDRPDFLVCAAVLGAGCGWMRWRTDSLWPAVALHWLMVTIWQTWLGGFTL